MGSSNIARRAQRKKQTRLTFDPVVQNAGSNSPAQSPGPSPAKVRYEKTNGKQPTGRGATNTSAVVANSPLRSSLRSTGKDKRQGKIAKNSKLNFGSLPTPAKSSQKDDAIIVSSGDNSSGPRRSARSVTKVRQSLEESRDSSDESTAEIQNTTPLSKRNKPASAVVICDDSSTTSVESEDKISKSTVKQSSSAQKSPRSGRSFISGGSTYNAPVFSADRGRAEAKAKETSHFQRSPSISNRPKKRRSVTLSDTSDDDVFTSNPNSTPRPSMFSTKLGTDLPDSDSEASQQEGNVDSDDEIRLPSSIRRRPPIIVAEPRFEDDSDEEPLTSPMKRRRPTAVSDEEYDDDESASPVKKMKPTLESSDEDSPSVSRISVVIPSSSDSSAHTKQPVRARSPRKHRTAKQKQLEILKRKRAGESNPVLTESESDEEEVRGIYDSGSDALSTFEDEEEEEEEQEVEETRKRRTPKKSTVENQDEYDSDFVDDDDDGLIGVPDHAMIPLEFTAAAHKPLKEHFSEAVEWCVQTKINPGYNKALQPIYTRAWNKLNDAYSGLTHSKFVSPSWTREFTKALYARPQFSARRLEPGEGIDLLGEAKCEACNRRKHVPTWGIQLMGSAYHKDSLAEVEKDSEDSDDDGNDGQSMNSRDEPIPSQNKEFLVGVVCKENAENAHILIHMKYALNQWVIANLQEEGHLTIQKLAKRDKMSAKKRQKEVNAIVDHWKEENEIKELYNIWKTQLETAQNASTTGRR
ncbi:transcription factor iiic protein [Rutstroemia sp. NJR-2017a BBW]|nr:transcription factor iiic protein [Rutstroemia sp. NJR-2017a BBW]